MWKLIQIKKHIETAKLLDKIKEETFKFIGVNANKNISEKDVQKFILKKFKENNIMTDKNLPIVAFNENSSIPHYFVSTNPKILNNNSIILIDIWAKFKNSDYPFADITWIAYYGKKIPKKIQKTFNLVIKARDESLNFIKAELSNRRLPTGKEVDKIARDIIEQEGISGKFLHGTGHSLGFTSPHGNKSNLNKKGKQPLLINVGYTIEPGIYLENEFGIRSEIDFYINNKKEIIVTTNMQNKIKKVYS
jgi:Xaa-Pro aminopeptidase